MSLELLISEKLKKAVAVSEEKSRSVPEGGADFPAAIFLAGKCPNLGRDSISCCRKIGEEFSSSVDICRKTFPVKTRFLEGFLRRERFREGA